MPPEKEIKVTVVYPVTFITKINPHEDIYKLRDRVKDKAEEAWHCSSIDPVITDCEDFPDLVE